MKVDRNKCLPVKKKKKKDWYLATATKHIQTNEKHGNECVYLVPKA